MLLLRFSSIVLVIVWCLAPVPGHAGPYLEFGVGVTTRDVVEKGAEVFAASTAGEVVDTGSFRGNADSTRFIAEIGWNIVDRVELYGNVGGSDLSIDRFNNFNADFDLLLGGGAKVNWYTAPGPSKLTVFSDFSAFTFKADDTIFTLFAPPDDRNNELFSREADEAIRWTQYTLKLGVSFVHEILDRPYAGIRLSMLDGSDTVTFRPDDRFDTADRRTLDLKEDDNFGLFFGSTFFFDPAERAGVNLEVSLFDEFSFMTAFRLNF